MGLGPFPLLFCLAAAFGDTGTDVTSSEVKHAVSSNYMSPIRRNDSPELFRLGSGALVYHSPSAVVTRASSASPPGITISPNALLMLTYMNLVIIFWCLVCLMINPSGFQGGQNPQGNLPGMISGGRDFNYRIPPPGHRNLKINTASGRT